MPSSLSVLLQNLQKVPRCKIEGVNGLCLGLFLMEDAPAVSHCGSSDFL